LLFYRLAGTNGPPDIYQKRADGRGGHEVRLAVDGIQQPMDASPDGRYLVYNDANRATIRDIWLLPLSPAAQPRPYLRTTAVEQDARVSPDSRWIAFMSSESGKAEVYVAPIDDPDARRRVSADGGLAPRWRGDGRELVYVDLNDTIMALDFGGGTGAKPGRPRPLFSAGRLHRNPGGGFGEPYYDMALDGQSFLVNRIVHDAAVEPITVVLNWPSLLGK
jgi:dipeptidyl aminopeptidase/acylaminoacyl peptidase